MHLGATVFIVLEKALYMFRVLFAPIIRSILKLYMQLLVTIVCRCGVRSDWLKDDRESGEFAPNSRSECYPRNNKDNCFKLHHVGCFINRMMLHGSTNIKFRICENYLTCVVQGR